LIASDGFDPGGFLQDYWQRQPLLIRNALPDFEDPLCAEELAGLSLEPDIESRLIERTADTWLVEYGPFQENSFACDNPWTLLVQAVDHYVPAVARLRQLVDFLPQWRIDDVMVSYASDGGGVGPHYDNYDVFLLQGRGRRRWRLGQYCDEGEALLPHEELRILANFIDENEYILEAGDILYVPPRLAHWGIAIGDCMTYSIGLRAPRINDLLSRWADDLTETLDPELLYRDPPLIPAGAAGEITHSSVQAALAQLQSLLEQAPENPDWFGELVTEPRYGDVEPPTPRNLAPDALLSLNPASRLAWSQQADALRVYANGDTIATPLDCRDMLEQLCGGQTICPGNDAGQLLLLEQLYQLGCIDVC
jgi:50S ribosomal protein L16 3-hydroxylase